MLTVKNQNADAGLSLEDALSALAHVYYRPGSQEESFRIFWGFV